MSRLTTSTIAAGAAADPLPETRSLITGQHMTSMAGGVPNTGGSPAAGKNLPARISATPNSQDGATPGGGGQPPKGPGGAPPGLTTPRGDAVNVEHGAILDPTRLLMMGMGAGNKLQVPKWPHVAQLPQWLIQLGKNLVAAGGKTDTAEVAWLNGC